MKAIQALSIRQKRILLFVALLGSLVFALSALAKPASPIPEKLAVKAIMGEACGEGYQGMLAVAGAIRNRGTLQGVYGVKNPAPNREPKAVWDKARKAWKASAKVDITHGATHWENVRAFGQPYWAKDMVTTLELGNHRFMKPKRRA